MKIRIEKLEQTKFAFSEEGKVKWADVKEGINYSMEFKSVDTVFTYGHMSITKKMFDTLKVGAVYSVSLKFSKERP